MLVKRIILLIAKFVDEFGHDLSLSGSAEAVEYEDPLFLQRNGRYRWVEALSKSLENVIPPGEHCRQSGNSFQISYSRKGVTCGGS